jgi:hypothetical protein
MLRGYATRDAMSSLIDACPECAAEVDAILRPGDPARRDQFLRLVANGVPTAAEFVLEPCGHAATASQIRLGTVDGIVHIQLRVLTATAWR